MSGLQKWGNFSSQRRCEQKIDRPLSPTEKATYLEIGNYRLQAGKVSILKVEDPNPLCIDQIEISFGIDTRNHQELYLQIVIITDNAEYFAEVPICVGESMTTLDIEGLDHIEFALFKVISLSPDQSSIEIGPGSINSDPGEEA